MGGVHPLVHAVPPGPRRHPRHPELRMCDRRAGHAAASLLAYPVPPEANPGEELHPGCIPV
jgi:hypothetical protein